MNDITKITDNEEQIKNKNWEIKEDIQLSILGTLSDPNRDQIFEMAKHVFSDEFRDGEEFEEDNQLLEENLRKVVYDHRLSYGEYYPKYLELVFGDNYIEWNNAVFWYGVSFNNWHAYVWLYSDTSCSGNNFNYEEFSFIKRIFLKELTFLLDQKLEGHSFNAKYIDHIVDECVEYSSKYSMDLENIIVFLDIWDQTYKTFEAKIEQMYQGKQNMGLSYDQKQDIENNSIEKESDEILNKPIDKIKTIDWIWFYLESNDSPIQYWIYKDDVQIGYVDGRSNILCTINNSTYINIPLMNQDEEAHRYHLQDMLKTDPDISEDLKKEIEDTIHKIDEDRLLRVPDKHKPFANDYLNFWLLQATANFVNTLYTKTQGWKQ